MADEMDQPEPEGYELAVPFVVCVSQGGPFDDDAFTAGFQCGDLARSLAVAAVAGATTVEVTLRTALTRQAELLGMHYGFPIVEFEEWVEAPEWTLATFRRSSDGGPTDA